MEELQAPETRSRVALAIKSHPAATQKAQREVGTSLECSGRLALSAEAGAGRLTCVQEGCSPKASLLLVHPYSPFPSCGAK